MPYIVMEAQAAVPASWKWSGGRRGYRKIAVVETDGRQPKMISERAHGVIRIVQLWDRLYQGTTERSEYHRVKREAEALAARLNEKTPPGPCVDPVAL